ncbi:hypothetical protein LCGC14_3131250 [marine sediment metagenome]|uniref:Uncharacterized protein n=1 Tax=marine sediment metagenome TaxID=412755 RepID=A0A0F8WNE8_9ZZZZ
MTEEEQTKITSEMPEQEQSKLLYDWTFWARPKQLPPDDFFIWLLLSGRGFGNKDDKSGYGCDYAKIFCHCY